MGIKDPRGDNSLHVAYATGVLKFLKYAFQRFEKQSSFSLADAYKVAITNDNDADFFIFEFIKDCGTIFTTEQLNAIDDGDHILLWKYINADLKRFNHPPVEPVAIHLP